MKAHPVSGDQRDEADPLNSTLTKPKPNVHLAQKPLHQHDLDGILDTLRNQTPSRKDAEIHFSIPLPLLIQARSNLPRSSLTVCFRNGKYMAAAHANTHAHSLFFFSTHEHKTYRPEAAVLEERCHVNVCGSPKHAAILNTPV